MNANIDDVLTMFVVEQLRGLAYGLSENPSVTINTLKTTHLKSYFLHIFDI
jgi:hypothetical protein